MLGCGVFTHDDFMATNSLIAGLTESLLAGIAGDQAAYHDFLTRVSPLLRRMIGRKVPACDVEDVLQEVLVSLHHARHTYDGSRPLLPWVGAIASYHVSDYLRKTYRHLRHPTVDIADYKNILAAVTENTEASESIGEMLNSVAPREKKILTLMHGEGYTAKQVGEQLGMKESAVKVAAHRAMKRIREQFTHD